MTSSCHANALCTNSIGSYECSCNLGFHGNGKICVVGLCDDRSCPANQKCILSTTNDCECKKGFEIDDEISNLCEDIDECLLNHGCDANSICSNLDGTYTCSCKKGYFGDGKSCQQGSCTKAICDSLNEKCVSPREIGCECETGYERDQNGTCLDVDECSTDMNDCSVNAACENQIGAYNCTCNSVGFTGDGTSCSDVDECLSISAYCVENSNCKNTVGSFSCSCDAGFGSVCRLEWILVLSSYSSKNVVEPLLINGYGQSKELMEKNFKKEDSVLMFCSLVWNSKMYVFGRDVKLANSSKIFVVDDCKMTKISELPWDMSSGAPLRHPHLFWGALGFD